jgi:hypothetical protein
MVKTIFLRVSTQPQWLESKVLTASVFFTAFLFFLFNLWFLSPVTFARDNVIFGADTSGVFDELGQVISSDNDFFKHPFFTLTAYPLVHALQWAPFLDERSSKLLVLALLSALCIVGAFLLLKGYFSSTRLALLFTCLYAFFFSNLVIYSIPETYSMSNLAILLYLSYLLRVRGSLDGRNSLVLSLLAGFASLFNAPLLSLMIIHLVLLLRRFAFKRWALLAVVNVMLGGLVFLLANFLIHGWAFLNTYRYYANGWASIGNLLDMGSVATVIVDFFLFSVLNPTGQLPRSLGWQDLSGYWRSPLGTVLFPLLASYICYSLFTAIKHHKSRLLAGSLLSWMLLMALFHTYFNPREAMLYSSQILVPLSFILALAFETIRVRTRIKYGVMATACALLALNNCLSLYAGVQSS